VTEEALQRNACAQDADDAADTLDITSPAPKPLVPSEDTATGSALKKKLSTSQADMDVLEQENMAY